MVFISDSGIGLTALLNDVDALCSHFSVIKEASELAKQIRKFSTDTGK
jgi:hypothetical protein